MECPNGRGPGPSSAVAEIFGQVVLSRSCSYHLHVLMVICSKVGLTLTQIPQAPGSGPHQVCPPCSEAQTSLPGVAESKTIRRTAVQRRSISPTIEAGSSSGWASTHAYVRRYWIPIIGPGAVADLLRLTAAAHSGRSLPEPTHVSSLLKAGLIRREHDTIVVPDTVRSLDEKLVKRLPTPLRRTHP